MLCVCCAGEIVSERDGSNSMNYADDSNNSTSEQSRRYQIRIKGELRTEWEEWFWGFTITQIENGDTEMSGYVRDQTELFGLLRKIRDLGLPLISLTRVESDEGRSDIE